MFVCDIYPCWFFCSISFALYLSIIVLCLSMVLLWLSSCSFLRIYITWLFFRTCWILTWFFLTFGIILAIIFLFHDYPQTLLYFWDPLASMLVFFNFSYMSFIILFLIFFFWVTILQSGYYLLTYFPLC